MTRRATTADPVTGIELCNEQIIDRLTAAYTFMLRAYAALSDVQLDYQKLPEYEPLTSDCFAGRLSVEDYWVKLGDVFDKAVSARLLLKYGDVQGHG